MNTEHFHLKNCLCFPLKPWRYKWEMFWNVYEPKKWGFFHKLVFSGGDCFCFVLSFCPVCQVKYKSLPSVHFSGSTISMLLPCMINFKPKSGPLKFPLLNILPLPPGFSFWRATVNSCWDVDTNKKCSLYIPCNDIHGTNKLSVLKICSTWCRKQQIQ